jgi:hypothetical protein
VAADDYKRVPEAALAAAERATGLGYRRTCDESQRSHNETDGAAAAAATNQPEAAPARLPELRRARGAARKALQASPGSAELAAASAAADAAFVKAKQAADRRMCLSLGAAATKGPMLVASQPSAPFAAGTTPHGAARASEGQHGGGRDIPPSLVLLGVACVRHTLRVEAPNPSVHHAELRLTYVFEVKPTGLAPNLGQLQASNRDVQSNFWANL